MLQDLFPRAYHSYTAVPLLGPVLDDFAELAACQPLNAPNGEAKAARNAPLPHTLQTLLRSTAQYALALSLLLAPLYALEQRIQHL